MRSIKWLIRLVLNRVLKFVTTAGNLISILKLFFLSYRQIQQRKILIVSIRDFNNGRYGFQLVNYFSKAGYDIYFYKSFRFLINLYGYDRLIFKLPKTYIWKRHKRTNSNSIIWLRLNFVDKMHKVQPKTIIDVDLNYFAVKDLGICEYKMPYYIHPVMNFYLDNINKSSKKSNILFYGSEIIQYDKFWIEKYFKKISRQDIFNYLVGSGVDMIIPESYSDFRNKFDQNRGSLFLLNRNKVNIPANDWLSILSEFNFFVAAPGIQMPLSHNAIEAMAVGTILILSYPEMFNPELKDGINCLVYSNFEELCQKIEYAKKMDAQELEIMRKNVMAYFDDHIHPSGFYKKICDNNCGLIKLYLNAEESSLKELKLG